MPNLKDFLHEKASQTNQLERRKQRDEWVGAVDRLIAQLRDWLCQADSENVLEVHTIPLDKGEQGLGTYHVPSLEIHCEGTVIRILPVGRNVLHSRAVNGTQATKAQGRVDITNGASKYYLYRFADDRGEQWELMDEDGVATLLDRAQFERIIQELLT